MSLGEGEKVEAETGGETSGGREPEGSGWLSWGKDREGEQEKRYLDRGSHYGISKKAGTREIPGNPQG